MPFPQPSEYDDAIQNPRRAFSDLELQNGINDGPLRFGMPGPVASGNFAVVYRFRCGSRRYAVKCFTRQPPDDQARRFASIHDHLRNSRLNCAAEFHFYLHGIHVNGSPYPILKMEWLDAPTLLAFVPAHLADKEAFKHFSDIFLGIAAELRKHQIAHGDLQHGNILVLADKLKIIDYDGMCVPGTAGLVSEEDGLPHYQHPSRRGGRLATYFDHFPALVIWTSLYALSIDPTLWTRYVRDEERLLFSKSDFANPQGASIFHELIAYGDERLTKAVQALQGACKVHDLSAVPHLCDIITSPVTIIAPDWWKEHLSTGVTSAEEKESAQGQPEWMTSNETTADIEPVAYVHFNHSLGWDRVFIYGYLLAVSIGTVGAVAGAVDIHLLFAVFVGAGGFVSLKLFATYHECPAFAQKRATQTELLQVKARLRDFEGKLRRWRDQQDALIRSEETPVKHQEESLIELQNRCQQRKLKLDEELQRELQKISSDKQQVDFREQQILQNVSRDIQKLNASLADQLRAIDLDLTRIKTETTSQIDDLRREREKKKEIRLKALSDEFVRTELMKSPIRAAYIDGLTASSAQALRGNGINCAADFLDCTSTYHYGSSYPSYVIRKADGSRVKVPGIGEKRAKALVEWRSELARKALRRAPAALPQSAIDAIERELEHRRQELVRRLNVAQTDAERLRKDAQEAGVKRKTELSNTELNAKQTAAAQRNALAERERQVRQAADAKKNEALAALNREIWQLQSIVNPAKHKVDQLRRDYQEACSETNRDLSKLKTEVALNQKQMRRFRDITFGSYISQVLGHSRN